MIGSPVGIDPVPTIALELARAFGADLIRFRHGHSLRQMAGTRHLIENQTAPLPNHGHPAVVVVEYGWRIRSSEGYL